MTIRRRKARPEARIQRAILDYLTRNLIPHARVNAGMWFVGEGEARRAIRGARAGTSDILACAPDGRFAAIEVKAPGNGVTEKQDRFLDRVESFGGLALVAYSLDDVRAVFEPMLEARDQARLAEEAARWEAA